MTKTPLSALKLDKDGEIAGYYKPESDRLLYEALKERLRQFGGDGKKAFAEPFRKPKHDGTPGPLVSKVKLCEPTTLSVAVHGGLGAANNDSMVRIDVFHVEGDGYYFIPIYIADTLKPELPDRACVRKPYNEWKTMQAEDFVFSLYPNDLLHVTHKTSLKLSLSNKESTLPATLECRDIFLYYISASISTASISCRNHDNTYQIASLGIKTLEKNIDHVRLNFDVTVTYFRKYVFHVMSKILHALISHGTCHTLKGMGSTENLVDGVRILRILLEV